METTIVKGCLYCGLRLPNTAHFCPECGRPVEVVIRFDSEVEKMRTPITRACTHCGLQLLDRAGFCPECGQPVERGRLPHADQKARDDCPETELEGKDDFVGQHETSSYS